MVNNLKFVYKNWKGEVSEREVMDAEIVWDQSDWHGEDFQWFLWAIDVEKDEARMFLMKDIIKFL